MDSLSCWAPKKNIYHLYQTTKVHASEGYLQG